MTMLETALEYIAKGWAPIPIEFREKFPPIKGWQNLRITAMTAPQYFNGVAQNVGVILGSASGGLTDVDLDGEEARLVASYFLPKTGAVFGREGSRHSRWLYRTNLAGTRGSAVLKYKDPAASDKKSGMIELRIGAGPGAEGNEDGNAQTVFPGSTHKTGEAITWELPHGEPTEIGGDELERCVEKLAAASALGRHWPLHGARHDACNALAGALLRAGWDAPHAKLFLDAVAVASRDGEWIARKSERQRAVDDTIDSLKAGKHVTGLPTLAKCMDKSVVDAVVEWLHVGKREEEAERPSSEEADGLHILHWHGEADDRPLREWAVEETLPVRGTALISGQWGTYKTFIALDLAASVMTRSAFAGRSVNRQGGVLFIALEGQDEIKVRLAAVIQEKVITALETEADIVNVNPDAMPFVWIETCPKLTSENALASLRKIVSAAAKGMRERFNLPLVAMMIDTLSPAAGFKDANDTAENQQVMTALKTVAIEFELCVIAVDHFGKDVTTGTRNSSVKEADVDAVLALLGERDLAGNVTNPRMAIRKVRGAPTGQEIHFDKRVVEVEDRGLTFSTLIIDWIGGSPTADPKKKGQWPKSLIIFKRALDAAMSAFGRHIRPFLDGPEVQAVDREKVREEFYKAYPGDPDAKRKTFRRGELDAIERGVLVSREHAHVTWFWLAADPAAGHLS